MRGKLRIMLEPLIPRRRSSGDESLARSSGAGSAARCSSGWRSRWPAAFTPPTRKRLSVAATMPRFVEMERRYGSLIRGLRAAARTRNDEARRPAARAGVCSSASRAASARSSTRWRRSFDGSIHRRARVVAARPPPRPRQCDPALAHSICRRRRVSTPMRWSAPHPRSPLRHCSNRTMRQTGAALAAVRYASAATVAMAFRASDFPQIAAQLRFRRAGRRAPPNYRRQLLEPQVCRARSRRNDSRARVYRRRAADQHDGARRGRDDRPWRARSSPRCSG